VIDCKKCKKRFTQTSWTRDRFWILVCPACVVEMLEKLLKVDLDAARDLGKG
jgi:hypothetical protein